MAIARQFATSVGTTATVLPGTQYPGFVLYNNGANTVFLGDSAVTTSTGFPVLTATEFSLDEVSARSWRGRDDERLYGIVAAATEDVRVLLRGRVNV